MRKLRSRRGETLVETLVSLLIVAGVEGSIFLLIVKRQRSRGDVREKRKKGKRSQSCRKTRRRK